MEEVKAEGEEGVKAEGEEGVKGEEAPKPIKLKKPKFTKVEAIKPEKRGLNLIVKVVSVAEAQDNFSEVVAGDSTGSVTFKLRAEHAQACKAGETMRVQNAKVVMVKGYVRLMVDKWGVIKPATEDSPGGCPDIEVKATPDISATEYELA